jgi:tripartite motif-containing protein 71
MPTVLLLISLYISSVTFVTQWDKSVSVDGEFHALHAVGYSSYGGGRIYVCDEAGHRIQYFNLSGTRLGSFGTYGDGNNEMKNPVCVVLSNSGDIIYVVERDNNRIHLFGPDGTHKSMFGTKGNGNGQFDMPAALAIAPDNTLFITDRMNHRVQHFKSDGTFLGKFGSQGTGNGQFNEPYGIAVAPDGRIYVTDSQNNRVQYFSASGAYLGQWGSTGGGDGQFGQPGQYNNGPAHAAIDNEGRIYICDPNHYRVQIFTAGGAFLGKIGGNYGEGNGEFAFPNCIALAPGGNIYVADETNNLIQQIKIEYSSQSSYTLTYTAGTGGSINGTSPQTVNYGSSGTAVTAIPDMKHHFEKWSDGITSNPRTDDNVTSDITVMAVFANNPPGGMFLPAILLLLH